MLDQSEHLLQTKYYKMREVGKLTTQCLDDLKHLIKPGISTVGIDNYVLDFQTRHNLVNAQFGYRMHGNAFPAHCCTSINEVMCHGIPSEKQILKKGDIVSVDITFIKDGYHGDACRTYIVGGNSNANKDVLNIVEVAKKALDMGIQAAQPGYPLSDIGRAIEKYVKEEGYAVSHDFVGHGIDTVFHGWPQIPHYYDKHDPQVTLQPGMTFTIEPIIVEGSPRYKLLNDGWTTRTRDKRLAAQFEATIGMTQNGNEIFCH